MSPELLAALHDVEALTPPAFAELGRSIPIEWLEHVLQLSPGFAKMRERKMPLDRVLWLVIGMAIFADRSIQAVVSHLRLALPGGTPGVDPSALPQARRRLGCAPIDALLDLTGQHWAIPSAAESRWRGLSLLASDGTCMRLPDTAVNEAEFKRPGSGHRSLAGYPQARLVALMAVRSHLVVAAAVGDLGQGEPTLIQPLLERIPDESLTILDRGFVSWKLVHEIHSQGRERHWLLRAKKNLRWKVLKTLGAGDLLVEIELARQLRRDHPELPAIIQARVVNYRIKGYRPQKLITSLVDARRFPKEELAGVYHERWEIELGYDELKTHMLERAESLRSKTPDGVRQEIAGILVAYNLVRQAMRKAALEVGVDPRRMSFRNSLLCVRNFCVTAWLSSAGTLPKQLIGLESDLRLLLLPERRSERRYDRTVKIKMSNYRRNRRRGSARRGPSRKRTTRTSPSRRELI
ncbi:MAG: IS4 family transposase [Terracidiphilus sp.]